MNCSFWWTDFCLPSNYSYLLISLTNVTLILSTFIHVCRDVRAVKMTVIGAFQLGLRYWRLPHHKVRSGSCLATKIWWVQLALFMFTAWDVGNMSVFLKHFCQQEWSWVKQVRYLNEIWGAFGKLVLHAVWPLLVPSVTSEIVNIIMLLFMAPVK